MLDSKEVQEAIDKFRKYVIQQSRSNLTKMKKNSSKALYNLLMEFLRLIQTLLACILKC